MLAEWLRDCGALIQQNELAEVYGDARQSTPAMYWLASRKLPRELPSEEAEAAAAAWKACEKPP